MITINNLTIEQMREIVEGAPEGAELFNKFYIRNVHSEGYMDHFAKWNGCKWQQAEAHREFVDEAICLNDLRTAIAEHELKPCTHGYDIACLICGFGNENGVRVWRKQIESDEVTDIRNHISPSTKVIDHG